MEFEFAVMTKYHKKIVNWRSEMMAGFVVFLVALPLCMGIAHASGAPVLSGIISGIVAGIVVSWLSGSEISVSGPAAGLILTVSAGITTLGSWEALLAATVLAGCIQVLLSRLGGGTIASYFPNSVIKGMLAAIGLTIIFKQIPHAVGWDTDFEGDESFFHFFDHGNTNFSLFESFEHMAEGAVIVSLVGFLVYWIWTRSPVRTSAIIKLFPASLAVAAAGVLTNLVLTRWWPHFALVAGSPHMVNVPSLSSLNDVKDWMMFPDFSVLARKEAWTLALSLALIASIESLLSVEAIERMDPERRSSDGNRELMAQGIGNIICGLIGGLAMTSVIVRSSANIQAGGRTRLSGFFHGMFLLLIGLFMATELNQIPLAALAVLLIVVGYQLVSPSVIKKVWNLGLEQFIPFMVTLVAVVMTDLLTGVLIGVAVGFLVIARMNQRSAITVVNDDDHWLVRFAKDLSFTHKAKLKRVLASLPENSTVLIDGAGASFIDFDILEQIADFLKAAPSRGIKVTWRNLRSQRFKLGGTDGELQKPSFGE